MRINELESPYRELAEMRMQEYGGSIDTDCDLIIAFNWGHAKEGVYFWDSVNKGNNPLIIQSSLDELNGYKAELLQMKLDNIGSKDEKKSKDSIDKIFLEKTKPNDKLFTAAVAAMQGVLSNNAMVDHFSNLQNEVVIKYAWDYAEALIAEGKKRNHL